MYVYTWVSPAKPCFEVCFGVCIGGVKHAPLHEFLTRHFWKRPHGVSGLKTYDPKIGFRRMLTPRMENLAEKKMVSALEAGRDHVVV